MTYIKSTIVAHHPYEGWVVLWMRKDPTPTIHSSLPLRWAALGNFAKFKKDGSMSPLSFRHKVDLSKNKDKVEEYIREKLTIFKVLGEL